MQTHTAGKEGWIYLQHPVTQKMIETGVPTLQASRLETQLLHCMSEREQFFLFSCRNKTLRESYCPTETTLFIIQSYFFLSQRSIF